LLKEFYKPGEVNTTHKLTKNNIPTNNYFASLDLNEVRLNEYNDCNCKTVMPNIPKNKCHKVSHKTPKRKTLFKNNITRNRVSIFADSHGKNMFNKLTNLLPSSSSLFICSNPNGTSHNILQNAKNMTKDFTKDDTIVLILGTNDLANYEDTEKSAYLLISRLKKFTEELQNTTNIIIVSLFYRHDIIWGDIHETTEKVNSNIKKISSPGVIVIEVDDFLRTHFTNHGLHLNKRGKYHLSKKIIAAIKHKPICEEITSLKTIIYPSDVDHNKKICNTSTVSPIFNLHSKPHPFWKMFDDEYRKQENIEADNHMLSIARNNNDYKKCCHSSNTNFTFNNIISEEGINPAVIRRPNIKTPHPQTQISWVAPGLHASQSHTTPDYMPNSNTEQYQFLYQQNYGNSSYKQFCNNGQDEYHRSNNNNRNIDIELSSKNFPFLIHQVKR